MAKTNPIKAQNAAVDDIPETNLETSKIVGRGLRRNRKLSLRALREAVGKTQLEIADTASMNQGDVSKLEQRDDVRLSTLRRYVAALGGELELVVVLPAGKRVNVDL
jgi:hypothetical protein